MSHKKLRPFIVKVSVLGRIYSNCTLIRARVWGNYYLHPKKGTLCTLLFNSVFTFI